MATSVDLARAGVVSNDACSSSQLSSCTGWTSDPDLYGLRGRTAARSRSAAGAGLDDALDSCPRESLRDEDLDHQISLPRDAQNRIRAAAPARRSGRALPSTGSHAR